MGVPLTLAVGEDRVDRGGGRRATRELQECSEVTPSLSPFCMDSSGQLHKEKPKSLNVSL